MRTMARKRQSAAEDILDIAASLPWPLSLFIAAVLYLGLHHFASLAPLAVKSVAEIGEATQRTMLITLARIFQYLLPILFVIGAGASWIKQRKAGQLHDRVAAFPKIETLREISWREFEQLVAEHYRRKGYQVKLRGGNGPDGGVDVELRLQRDAYFVQCKHWRAQQVGAATVRELYGVMQAEGAVGGFVVTSGRFTKGAEDFAHGRGIELVPAERFLGEIRSNARRL
ncbi:MAG: hypothetical protein B7Z79_11355 [Thiomonas sp. 20-64-9]|nr:MAG: hypothetical protein B7Z79_11355 [Thiomonas sp. 20-64-9]